MCCTNEYSLLRIWLEFINSEIDFINVEIEAQKCLHTFFYGTEKCLKFN